MITCFFTAVSEFTFCKTSLNGSTPILYFMRTHPIYCFNYSYHIVFLKYYIIAFIMTKIIVGQCGAKRAWHFLIQLTYDNSFTLLFQWEKKMLILSPWVS